ncbi:MAG: type II toxin-antitoxin system HicB family antitoxin [Hespellia sp.]|nr:type II toxin-antitoxin system HicB family antitoxin [Hespellia sp.]
MKLIYPAVFYPFSDGSGGYVVEFPDLPGCVTEGKNLEEAFEMGNDAASGWILGEMEEGNLIPEASAYETVPKRTGGQVNMMILDMDAYAEKYGEKAVRKNLTIPAWLNTFAEKHSINFSQVLQEALMKKAKR